MKNSDDMTNRDLPQNEVDAETEVEANGGNVDGFTVPSSDLGGAADGGAGAIDNGHDETTGKADAIGEIAAFAVKTVAVVMSLIIMLTCILAIGLPLTSMRIFNKLGMSARAVDFGERYIEGRLESNGASATDGLGNFTALSSMPDLSDSDMTEALFVCSKLSYDLMEDNYALGKPALGAYYAERVEKFTRIYLSLNGVSALNAEKSRQNVAAMPLASMHPMVYSYGNGVRNMNYRARAYLGKTGVISYSGKMTELSLPSNSFSGTVPGTPGAMVDLLDNFTDYITQLGEYLDVEFKRAGVINDVYAMRDVAGVGEVPVVSEMYVMNNYDNKLRGTEFSMFVNNASGFTAVYNNLKMFGEYAKMAVEFEPSNGAGNIVDEQLHKLYWLQAFDKAALRFWYLDMLLYYNRDMYGAAADAIKGVYPNDIFSSAKSAVANEYSNCLKEYLDRYLQA